MPQIPLFSFQNSYLAQDHPSLTRTCHLPSWASISHSVESFLPWKLDSHCKNCDVSLLHLHCRHCGTALGLSIRNDDQDFRDARVSATRESLAENVLQSLTCLCAPTSRKKGEKTRKAEIRPSPDIEFTIWFSNFHPLLTGNLACFCLLPHNTSTEMSSAVILVIFLSIGPIYSCLPPSNPEWSPEDF